MKISIIGAGPAGIYTSLLLKNFSGEIHLFEQNDQIGKKLERTGGGRMNIANKVFSEKQFSSTQTNTPSYSSDWFMPYGPDSIFWMRGVMLGDPTTIQDDNWLMLTLVWDESEGTYEGFVDGVSIGTSGVVSNYGGVNSVKIGSRGDGTTAFFSGSVADVIIWEEKVSSGQIQDLYTELIN